MGQNSSINTKIIKKSFEYYRKSLPQSAFNQFLVFLNSQLNEDDIKSIKQYSRRGIIQDFLAFNKYLKWLYQQSAIKQSRMINLQKIFTIVKQIYQRELKFAFLVVQLEEFRKRCLYFRYLKKAQKFQKENKIKQGIDEILELRKYYPKEYDIFYSLGILYQKINQLTESQLSFLQALQIRKDENILLRLVILYQEMGLPTKIEQFSKQLLQMSKDNQQYKLIYAESLYMNKKWKEASELFYQIIRNNPKRIDLNEKFNKSAINSQNHEKALSLYLYLIEVQPNNELYYFNVGIAYRDLGNRKQAIKFLRNGLQIKQNYLAYYYLGLIYQLQQQEDDMFCCFQKSIRLNNKFADVYEKLGDYYSKNEEYLAQALEFYEEQLRCDEKNVQAYFDIGREEYNKGNIYRSIEFYKKAVQISPQKYQSYLLLASSKSRVEQYDQATLYLQIAIGLNPNKWQAYNLLGNAYFGLKKLNDAIKSYQKASQINPKHELPYFNLGFLYFNQQQYDKSEYYLKECIKRNCSNSWAYYLLSQIYLQRNQSQKCIKYLEDTIANNPTDPQGHFQLGLAHFELYQYQKALENFKTAYQLDVKNQSSIYNIGTALVLLKRAEEGISWIFRALELKGNKLYRCGYGIALVQLHRYQQAINQFYKVIHSQPEYFEAYFHLGKALNFSHKQQEERENYMDLLKLNNQTSTEYECRAFFFIGLEDFARFWMYFNLALNLLKKKLLQNQRQGKKEICKFMRSFISNLSCAIRDYEESHMVITLGILNRDIGDGHKTRWCFNRIIGKQKFVEFNSLHEKCLKFYQTELTFIRQSTQQYFIFLLEFILQQLLKLNINQGLLFYKKIMKDDYVRKDASISNLIQCLREQRIEILRVLLQDHETQFQIRKKKGQLTKKKINIDSIITNLFSFFGETSLQEEKLSQILKKLKQLTIFEGEDQAQSIQDPFYKEIKDQIDLIFAQNASQIQEIVIQNKQEAVLMSKLLTAFKKHWKSKLKFQLSLILFKELSKFMNLQQELSMHFQIFIISICEGRLKLQDIFTQLYHIVERYSTIKHVHQSNFLEDQSIYTINLKSSIIYEDYEYQKSNASIKSATFAKQVDSKVNDTIQPKKKINRKNIIELSSIEPYNNYNIFQRDLTKQSQWKSSINLRSKSQITSQSTILQTAKYYKSSIFDDNDVFS